MPKSTRRAMTLIEVLAVVVILGLLAGALAVGFSGTFAKGKREIAKTGIGVVIGKVEAYYIEHDRWPEPELGVDALTDGQASPTSPYYLKPDQVLDPWNRKYVLIVPGPDGRPYEIVSYGADGQPGGENENTDLTSVNLRDDGP